MVVCLERGADLHMAQLMPLPLTVSCFGKIQIGFTFLVPAHPGSPGKGPLNSCVCVCVHGGDESLGSANWHHCLVHRQRDIKQVCVSCLSMTCLQVLNTKLGDIFWSNSGASLHCTPDR